MKSLWGGGHKILLAVASEWAIKYGRNYPHHRKQDEVVSASLLHQMQAIHFTPFNY